MRRQGINDGCLGHKPPLKSVAVCGILEGLYLTNAIDKQWISVILQGRCTKAVSERL